MGFKTRLILCFNHSNMPLTKQFYPQKALLRGRHCVTRSEVYLHRLAVTYTFHLSEVFLRTLKGFSFQDDRVPTKILLPRIKST